MTGSWHYRSMADDSWTIQGQQADAGLAPVRCIIGEWIGEGYCHGEAVTGRMHGAAVIDGSWIEVEETLIGADGSVVHTDRSLYRFNVEAEALEAIQLFERASMTTSLVESMDDGFRWITGPGAPQLRFFVEGDRLRYTVILPGEDAPAAEMTYKRA